MDELLTVEEVARYCRVHKATIRRHIASGRLRAVRIGRAVRVRREDLEQFADRNPSAEYPNNPVNGKLLPPLTFDKEPRPFTKDDPLWGLVGMIDDPEGPDWISSDKHRALADAYMPKP